MARFIPNRFYLVHHKFHLALGDLVFQEALVLPALRTQVVPGVRPDQAYQSLAYQGSPYSLSVHLVLKVHLYA